MEETYLVQRAICRVVDDLQDTRLAGEVARCVEAWQAESAWTGAVYAGHDLGEVVRRLGVGGGQESPFPSWM